MNFHRISSITLWAVAFLASVPLLNSCSKKTIVAPVQTTVDVNNSIRQNFNRRGPVIDKSNDTVLQNMIAEVVPCFRQYEYTVPGTERVLKYNLFAPVGMKIGEKYPLVVFIADSSTVGDDVTLPLTQGYGALVWANKESQAQNPCFVLVPQLSATGVDDRYTHTQEVDDVVSLVNHIASANPIDTSRLYSTGQSMGGMMAMYYDVAYPNLFAASIFVDSHWDQATFFDLVHHKFVWFIAGQGGKAYPTFGALKGTAELEGISYTTSEWDAQLPMEVQDELAASMLDKGAPINIIMFETGSVLPHGVSAPDHMYSFDYAYRNKAVRDWLFRQKK